jgi:hypothetical protein
MSDPAAFETVESKMEEALPLFLRARKAGSDLSPYEIEERICGHYGWEVHDFRAEEQRRRTRMRDEGVSLESLLGSILGDEGVAHE